MCPEVELSNEVIDLRRRLIFWSYKWLVSATLDVRSASISAIALVPLANGFISKTPMGPFQITDWAPSKASLNFSIERGPMSRPYTRMWEFPQRPTNLNTIWFNYLLLCVEKSCQKPSFCYPLSRMGVTWIFFQILYKGRKDASSACRKNPTGLEAVVCASRQMPVAPRLLVDHHIQP